MGFDLASITRGAPQKPPRLVLYAPHGVGKTTFGAMAPNPIVLPFEDGIGRLDVPVFPQIKSYAEAVEALGTLVEQPHDFQTVVLDTLDWFEPMIWAETATRHSKKDIEDFGYGKGYAYANDLWREYLDGLNVLREQRGMQVILLAHCDVKAYNDPSSEPYDRYTLKLHKGATAIVQEWADAVLFANYRTYTQQTDKGFNQKVTRGVGTGERVMYTEERPSYYAKNRYQLPPELPFSYESFNAAMNPQQVAA
ncbi:MAG: ATP-binding protein [Burkholderiales bacterium]|nr:MAG: ATP-binding protein [Burkholderiales bacterium]